MRMKAVIFNGAEESEIKWGGNDDPNTVLTRGNEYAVEDTEEHSWHTKIKIHGVEGWFNDSSFSYIA